MSKGGWYANPADPSQKGIFLEATPDGKLRIAWKYGRAPFPGEPVGNDPEVTTCKPSEVEKLFP